MALIKDKILTSGVTANYWRVDTLVINKNGSGTVRYSLYLNKTAVNNGCTPLLRDNVDFTGWKNSDFADKTPMDLAYEEIKKLPEFLDAAND